MTKYYRVRSEEQWDWLMQRFEKQSKDIKWENGKKPLEFCPTFNSSVKEKAIYLDGNQLTWGSAKYALDSGYCLIEVSQMMEDEKMEDYVTIYGKDAERIRTTSDGQIPIVKYNELNGRLTPVFDIADGIDIPKSLLYPKVRMSVAEKKEFDELKRHRVTVYGALDMIEDDYPKLYTRLFGNSSHEGDSKAQLEFARAWADPSLIEVIPDKKWNVKVPISHERDYYYKDAAVGGGKTVITNRVGNGSELWTDYDFQFTAGELKHYGLDSDLFEKVEVLE